MKKTSLSYVLFVRNSLETEVNDDPVMDQEMQLKTKKKAVMTYEEKHQ